MNSRITCFNLLTAMVLLFMPAFVTAEVPEVPWDIYDAHIAPAETAFIDYTLPFDFPFDGRIITTVSVNTNGRIELLEATDGCTFPCDEAGTHFIGVPAGMDAIFLANDDLTTGVVINGFADKVIISFTGSTTVDNDFFDDTVQMQVVMFSDGRIRWNFYSVYYTSYAYDLFSGLHLAGGTELPLPILDTNPADGITDYWPGFNLYDSYEFNGTDIVRIPPAMFDLYEDYVLLFDDAYQEFDLPFSFPFNGRDITAIAVNTNGLIELLEAGESAQAYKDADGDGLPDEYVDFSLFDGEFGTHALGDHITKNIDALFLANDDLITGAMINGDSNRMVITLSGIAYEGNQQPFVAKPLQMQVILFPDGGILWNFFTIENTSNDFDLYSGLYDEVSNTDTPLAGGTPVGADVMTAYEFVPDTTGSIPGDCNGDGLVDAGDISALVLEIFDGDGNLPADAPGGTFPGDPVGSDANEDGVVDAGDISCAILIIFYGPGACGGGVIF